MRHLRFLQIEKDNTEHFELIRPLWSAFCREVNEHDGVFRTDDELTDALRKRIGIQGSRPDMHFELALSGEEAVGFAMFAIDLGTVYGLLEKGCGTIMGFYIKPENRRQGLGREMYEHIESTLRSDGAPKIYLTPDSVTGVPFWTALGFANSGKFDPDDKKYIYIRDICETAAEYSAAPVQTQADIAFIAGVYNDDKNIEALHGERIAYDEWCAVLTANDPDEAHFLIRRGGVPCAWLKLNGICDTDTGWISMLVVDTDCHRMGAGTYAVSFAEDHFTEMGKRALGVQTTPDNTAALGLYKKCGFVEVHNGQSERVRLMKDISPENGGAGSV